MRLELIDIDEYIRKNALEQIPRLRIFRTKDQLDVEGLHSPSIYKTEDDKRVKVCYYDVGVEFIHPLFVYVCKKKSKLLYQGLLGITPVVIKDGVLVQVPKDGLTGKELVKALWEARASLSKEVPLLIRRILQNTNLKVLLPTKVLILPPALRPLYLDPARGWVVHPIDLLYMQIEPTKKSPQLLQATLSKLVEEIIEGLRGKEGIFRSQLLVRRTDFSARLVITVDPSLDIDYVKIPYRVLAMLFAPHIIRLLLHPPKAVSQFLAQKGLTIPTSESVVFALLKAYYSRGLELDLEELFSKVIDIVVEDKVVIVKRDPVLHRGSVFAVRPIGYKSPIKDVYVMSIPPHITSPLNADFDGDTMSVFAPQTVEAQREALSLLPSRNLRASGTGAVWFDLKLDYVLALFLLTAESLPIAYKVGKAFNRTVEFPAKEEPPYEELIWNYDLSSQTYVRYANKTFRTTLGRYIFNTIHNLNMWIDEVVTSKTGDRILSQVTSRFDTSGLNVFYRRLAKVCELVLHRFPVSISVGDFQIPKDMLSSLAQAKEPINFQTTLTKVEEQVRKKLPSLSPNLWAFVHSGATKGMSALRQIAIARGFVSDPTGRIIVEPIRNSYVVGLSPNDIYASAPGWRKGIIDKSLGTADAGYLTRKLTYLLAPVRLASRDCRTSTGLRVSPNDYPSRALLGRYTMDGSVITHEALEKPVVIRSPIYCRDPKGICEVCYGKLLEIHRSKEIGLISAQTLGERGTQLVLKTFHTGGAAELLAFVDVPPFVQAKKGVVVALKQLELFITLDKKLASSTSEGIVVYPQTLQVKVDGQSTTWRLTTSLLIPVSVRPEVIDVHHLAFTFKPGDVVGELLSLASDVTSLVAYVTSLLDKPVFDSLSLLRAIYNSYKTVATLPLIHFELLVSFLNRVKDDPELFWRHHQDKPPQIVSLQTAIASTSPLLALMFANPGVGVMRMLYSSEKEPKSALEELLL